MPFKNSTRHLQTEMGLKMLISKRLAMEMADH